MYSQNEYILMKLVKQKEQAAMQEAEAERLALQARSLPKSNPIREAPIIRLGCRGLACVGSLLIAVGRWLEKTAAARESVITIDRSSRGYPSGYT